MNATRNDFDLPHDQQANELIATLKSRNLKEVVFFWSPREGGSHTDGAAANFPLLSALVELARAGGTPEYKVFDGAFLKVGGGNRSYSDVKRVLDHAENLSNAKFGIAVLPFTSHLVPADAVLLMQNLANDKFCPENRATFFKVRGDGMTERELASN